MPHFQLEKTGNRSIILKIPLRCLQSILNCVVLIQKMLQLVFVVVVIAKMQLET